MAGFTQSELRTMTRNDFEALYALKITLPCKHSAHTLCRAPKCECICHVSDDKKREWLAKHLPSFRKEAAAV